MNGLSSKTLYFTVTNDLNYDQRMHRICNSLANVGYDVHLIGRKLPDSPEPVPKNFKQKRLSCFFLKGKLFYAEYNIRLFFYLLGKKMDGICAIDLDTILPVFFISKIKNVERIYDAHELFCEMEEIVSRPTIYKFWKKIERFTLPHFKHAYTVNEAIAAEFESMYGFQYAVIRNAAWYDANQREQMRENFLIYQGAVNEGRCFEQLIPAMQHIPCPLYIFGDGNFLIQAKEICKTYGLENKVFFKGKQSPDALRMFTNKAKLGINLVADTGKSYYLSLSNRFFDYIQAGTPQLCMNFPAYKTLNETYRVAIAMDDCTAEAIALQINNILNDEAGWQAMHNNCKSAAKILNWQNEEKKLLQFYTAIFE